MLRTKPAESIPATFARRLRELREAAGLTRNALAVRAGVCPSNLDRMERGERACTWETACRLADAIGVSVQKFR